VHISAITLAASEVSRENEEGKKTLLWLVLFCVGAILGGLYIKNQIGTSKLPAYLSKEVSPPAPSTGDKIPSQTGKPKVIDREFDKGQIHVLPG
jgi:hypothetical protein